MREYEKSTTAELLDFLSHYQGNMTDILVERWAKLEAENAKLQEKINELDPEAVCMTHGSPCALVPSFACPGCEHADG